MVSKSVDPLSSAVPVVRLIEVFRQAAEIQIIVNAHRINQGLMPDLAPLESGDFYFVDAVDADEAVRKPLAIVSASGLTPCAISRCSAR